MPVLFDSWLHYDSCLSSFRWEALCYEQITLLFMKGENQPETLMVLGAKREGIQASLNSEFPGCFLWKRLCSRTSQWHKQWTVAKWVEAIVPWMYGTLLVSIASDLWSPCIPDGSFPSLMCFQPTWKGQLSSAVCAPGRFSWANSEAVAGSGFSWMFWTHPRFSFWVNERGRAAHVRNDDY